MYGDSLINLPLSENANEVLAAAPGGSGGLPISVYPIPACSHLAQVSYPSNHIQVAQLGGGRRWMKVEGETHLFTTSPGMIEMYEAGDGFEELEWQGTAGRYVHIGFTDADVAALTHNEMEALCLPTLHERFDRQVSDLALELADEALLGWPNGKLYYHGLSVSLLGILANRYSRNSQRVEPRSAVRLSPTQRTRIIEFVDCHLGDDLSLAALASHTGFSAYYFSRLFKHTFGTTPHRYVQQRRVRAAIELLHREPGRPISTIAMDLGFSSQAHMTYLVRQSLGKTPGELRRE